MSADLHTLLTWAIDFVERETESLYQSYKGPDGSLRPEDEEEGGVISDIEDARRWLAEAREAIR